MPNLNVKWEKLNMIIHDADKLFSKLEEMGVDEVKLKLAQGVFAPKRKIKLVNYWLSEKTKGQIQTEYKPTKPNSSYMNPTSKEVWEDIYEDYEKIICKKNKFCNK
jgi:hypothetical protein